MIAAAVIWLVVAPVAAVLVGKGIRNRDERDGNTRAKQDAAQAAWLDARAAATRRGSRGSHHLAARRRGVDLRPAPWGDR